MELGNSISLKMQNSKIWAMQQLLMAVLLYLVASPCRTHSLSLSMLLRHVYRFVDGKDPYINNKLSVKTTFSWHHQKNVTRISSAAGRHFQSLKISTHPVIKI
jgi:hypothetical protein